jgi:hypothetical protein
MFDALYRLIDKTIGLEEKLILIQVLNGSQVQNFILDLNRDQLFREGKDANGNVIGYYTGFTEELNEGKTFSYKGESRQKKEGDPYLLYDTGDFYKSLEVQVYDEYFTVYGQDIKEDGALTQKYGNDILGITNENKGKLIEKILPFVIQTIRTELAK